MINNILIWIKANGDKIDPVYAAGIILFAIFATLICAVVF